jgi:hypothetical protein
MENIYPIDIAGIKNIGVEEWLENYYIPVTGRENYLIYNKVQTAYLSVLKKTQNDVVYRIAISNSFIPNHVSRYILELLRLIRLKDKGYGYIIGQKKEKIPSDISAYGFTGLSGINLICKRISVLTPQERAKNILRTIKCNILPEHLTNKNYLKNISKPYYCIGQRTLHEIVSFCRENEIAPIHLSPTIFAKKVPVKTNNDSQYVEMMEFIMKFLNLVRKRHPIIDNSAFELLRKSIEDCFRDSLSFFRQNIRVFGKHKPKNLLFSSGFGCQIHRLFCSAWRYAGGRVIGFTHGCSYSHCYSPIAFHELSIVDQHVTTSKGHEEIIKQSAKDFMPDYKTPNIIHLKNSIYKPLFGKLQSDPPVNKIKNIMVVGAVVKSYFPIDTEYHAFSFLYNDIQLIKILKKAGYYTIYEPRPDTMHETYGIFEKYADDVLKGKLEDVYNRADCLIFSSPYSNTFGFALLSNKPIVIINVEGYLWYPRAFELIKKRCRIVEAYSADGRIVFDEKELVKAVELSLNNIDYEILYEFAF